MLMKVSTNAAQAEGTAPFVRHYLPGGCDNGGGIGRLVGYVVSAARAAGDRHLVTDTRGEAWTVPASAIRLARALLSMIVDRLVAPERIHHIHVAGRGSTLRKLILTQAARLLGCHYILHLHDYDYANDFRARPAYQKWLIRRMFQRATRCVVLGRRDHDTLITLLGIDRESISIVHNCVPDPGPRDARFGEIPQILFLGRLSERKGVTDLVRALADPAMQQLQWAAIFAGDGPVDGYRRLSAEAGLLHRVEMPGWLSQEEVRQLCRRADILVLPSYAEGLAMAVMEGLAHGLAVVTTRVGAHEEVITDGETGIFVPVGDPHALAATLARLIIDRETREFLSLNARAHYLGHFTINAYLRSLERIYAHARKAGAS